MSLKVFLDIPSEIRKNLRLKRDVIERARNNNSILKQYNNTVKPMYYQYIYPTKKEGIGLTITEAMCTGMPVVTSNYPTMNEWLEDGKEGRLIKPKKIIKSSMPTDKVYIDTSHLAEILIDYIENPEKVTEHSLNARERIVKDFNWDDRDSVILSIISP